MFVTERQWTVQRLLADYVRSPSLRHLRDQHSLGKLAEAILAAMDHQPTVWRKWQEERESLIRAAATVWVPVDVLRTFLNELPGGKLTLTDVQQRLRAIHEEPYGSYPNEDVRESCLALFHRETEAGTELPAIIGALQDHVEAEEARLRTAHEAAWAQRRAEEREAREGRFLAGADTPWINVGKSQGFHCRKNGRAYRLQLNKEKRWELFRIAELGDPGKRIGTYGSRGDASKAVSKLAYEVEPKW